MGEERAMQRKEAMWNQGQQAGVGAASCRFRFRSDKALAARDYFFVSSPLPSPCRPACPSVSRRG